MRTRRPAALFVLLFSASLLLAILSGCRGSALQPQDAADPAPQGQRPTLPRLPAPASLTREASTINYQFFHPASSPYGVVPKQNVDSMNSSFAVFSPGSVSPGPAYACYEFFNRGAVNGSDTIYFDWLSPPPQTGQFWVALANFSLNRWDWHPGPAAGASLDISAGHADYVAPDGCLYVIVLLQDGPPCSLRYLLLGDNPSTVTLQATPASDSIELETTLSAAAYLYGLTSSSIDWDLDGDGTFELIAANTSIMPALYSTPGVYEPAVRYNLEEGGSLQASTTVTVYPFGNTGPSAFLQADVSSGNAPLKVELDASASSDFDTEDPLEYSWDLDGDGEFELHTGQQPQASVTLGLAGMNTLRVRVSDVEGFTATAQLDVEVLQGFRKELITGSNNANADFSLANIGLQGGLPALAASQDGQQALLYFRAGSENGAGFLSPVEVMPGHSVYDPRLAEVEGNPACAYKAPGQARYMRAEDADGAAWADSVLIESGLSQIGNLAVIGGKPAVACAHQNGNIYYFRSLDALGTVWASGSIAATVPSELSLGLPRLDSVSGGPPKLYFGARGYKGLVQDLGTFVCKAEDVQGSSFSQPERLLDIYSFYIAVAHSGNDDYLVAADRWHPLDGLFFRRGFSNSDVWGPAQNLDNSSGAGKSFDVVVFENRPLVAFTKADAWDGPPRLYLQHAADNLASSWHAPMAIDVSEEISEYCRMLRTPAGTPLLVYRSLAEQSLVAVRYE
ncbi:PKD domain-containing protein [bacterium]|nr:PKD domain-containing protein [bacterium]